MEREPEELAAMIVANPESPGAYAVLGDWLLAQGTPLGELVAVQIARHAKPKSTKLGKQEAALLERHRTTWLDGRLVRLEDIGELSLTWRWGFVQKALIGQGLMNHSGASAYEAIRSCYVMRFLRDLEIGALIQAEGYRTTLAAIAREGVPDTLNRLAIETKDVSRSELGSLDSLFSRLAKVEHLVLRATRMELGAINLPNLVTLDIAAEPLTIANVRALIDASLPRLEKLVLGLDFMELRFVDPELPLEEPLRELFATRFPALTSLTIRRTRHGDKIARVLHRSRMLGHLQRLDLVHSQLSDAGARFLIEQHQSFRHLDTLLVPKVRLTPDVQAALVAALPQSKLAWA